MEKREKKWKLRKKKILVIIGLVLVVLIGFLAWRMKASRERMTMSRSQTQTVTLEKRSLVTSVSATGILESAKSKTVTSTVKDLEVKKVLVSVGDKVKKGDALVRFDKSDLQEALSEAKDNLSNTITSANQEVSAAASKLSDAQASRSESASKTKSDISSAKSTKSKSQKRIKTLRAQIKKEKNPEKKKNLQEQLEKEKENLSQANNTLKNAKSSKSSTTRQSNSEVTQARQSLANAKTNRTKQIKEAKKQVKEAKENLKKCAITVPMSGTVTSVSVNEGDVFSGGSICEIQDVGDFQVTTSVDEYDIGNVKEGQSVSILTEATGDDEIAGEITFVAPTTSSSNNTSENTGMNGGGTSSSSSSSGYEVLIKVNSKDERLKVGMTAKCSIILEKAEDVLAVPYDAVHSGRGESYVTVIEGNEQKNISVTKGMESDYYVEVQSDELRGGMQVVLPTDKIEKSSDSQNNDNSFGMGDGGFRGRRDGDFSEGGGDSRGSGRSRRDNGGGFPSRPEN